MKKLCILIFIVIANAITAQSIFSDTLLVSYKKAFDQNESGQYLEAYRSMSAVRGRMYAEMGERTVDMLNEDDFLNYWWPINRSVAEIAYRLGLHSVMLRVADEMDSALALFPVPKDTYFAQLLKIDAGRHFLTGDFYYSEIELLEALRRTPPYELSFISDLHDELAQLYYRIGEYELALMQLDSVLPNPELPGQRALCMARLGRYGEAYAMLSGQTHAGGRAGAELLRQKAKVLMLQYDATGVYNPVARQHYVDYLRLSRAYIESHFAGMTDWQREQYWMAEQPFVTDCYRLEEKAPDLLYDVALYSKALLLQTGRRFKPGMDSRERKKVIADMKVTWQQVQRRLPDSAAAIEFIVYERGHEDHIGALVLKKKGRPRFVHIAAVNVILNHLLPNGSSVGDVLPCPWKADSIDVLYTDTSLHKLIWNDTLIRTLGDVPTIYFAPDGIFHRIAIEYMLEGRKLFRLTSTRMLVDASLKKIRTDSMLMVGDVDYGNAASTGEAVSEEETNDRLAYQLLAPLGINLKPLSGTKMEIDSVSSLRRGKTNRLLVADSATESTLRSLIEKYHIVLFSTHGWMDDVSQVGTELRPATTDAQLSESCLFLSGAERNMRDSTFDSGQLDGILSAREFASMNLSEVDLAVLSACVSGLGYVTPDGVYGLQRGLKTAGVHAVIVSLWNVDDMATSILIKNLFANLEKGLPLHEAFSQARLQLRNSCWFSWVHGRFRMCSFDYPYYTNAFVLIDGIE